MLTRISLPPPALLSSPNAALQNSLASVVSGAPSLNTPTPIDPSSMQRAYAALGLPYSNQTATPGQTPPGGQNATQGQHPQLMRPINALGKEWFCIAGLCSVGHSTEDIWKCFGMGISVSYWTSSGGPSLFQSIFCLLPNEHDPRCVSLGEMFD